MNTKTDNVKTGIFVFAGIVLGLVVVFTLSDFKSLLGEGQDVAVYYTLSDGLQGLETGSQVSIGGQPVGEVVEIQDFSPDGFIASRAIPEDPTRALKPYRDRLAKYPVSERLVAQMLARVAR